MYAARQKREGKMQTLLDFGDYPEIDTDGVGDVQAIGHKAIIYMFRWRRIDGLFQPVIVAAVARPLTGFDAPLPHKRDLEAMPQLVRIAAPQVFN
jgi:hypothetical protein